jgi:hypothetical protein
MPAIGFDDKNYQSSNRTVWGQEKVQFIGQWLSSGFFKIVKGRLFIHNVIDDNHPNWDEIQHAGTVISGVLEKRRNAGIIDNFDPTQKRVRQWDEKSVNDLTKVKV